MPEMLNRILLATESIIICFPLSAFFVSQRLPVYFRRVIDGAGTEAWVALSACIVLLTFMACVWRLIVAFSVDGSVALQRLSAYWWSIPVAGSALAVGILVHVTTALGIQSSWLREFTWSLPLIVPTAHLGLERWLRADSRHVSAGEAPPTERHGRRGTALKLVR
jgi:hypothetical protein